MGAEDQEDACADFAEAQMRFRALRQTPGGIDADPSGWRDTVSDAEALAPKAELVTGDLVQYHSDAVQGLASYGRPIIALVNEWDEREWLATEVTLCPSGTSASLAILLVLRDLGVKSVVFETPLYFASLEQAKSLGLETVALQTFRSNGYAVDLGDLPVQMESTAFWFTQPRAALGFDQTPNRLDELLRSVDRHNHYVVVDEVTEQRFPSVLRAIGLSKGAHRLIRIKSFTKGMGLNGIRLAAILHPEELKGRFIKTLDAFGGSVDVFSLATVATLATTPTRFKTMLAAANRQVIELRERTERMVAGSAASINHLVNGYIGSMIVDLTTLGRNQRTRRRAFLDGCLDARTPVVLGSSYSLAPDPPFEMVRLNFLIPPDSVMRGVVNILNVLNVN